MSEFTRTDFYYILIVWVVLPTVDQYTDIFMILKLIRGPSDDQWVKSEKFEGKFGDQPRMIQVLYQKAYLYFALLMSLPLVVSTSLSCRMCFDIEKKSSKLTRLLTLLLSVCGVYPQYRAVRTILTGLGLLSDDSWEHNRRVNMRLGQIEPVAEGMFQLICQSIILYIVNGPGESTDHELPVYLTSLLYEDTLHSKLVYAFFFFSSFLSVCTSFSTMLYKGENKLLTNIFSFTFLKIIIMTATKFIIQSYIISIAIKSLMYKFVSKFQYFPPHTEDNELFRDLEERYYRGLTWSQELLTFTEATLILPLIMIAILYLPSVIYITYVSLQFYGKQKWSSSVLADPVAFIFPVFTCISFYQRSDNIKKEAQQNEDFVSKIPSEVKRDEGNNQNEPTNDEIGHSNQVSPVPIEINVETEDVESQNVEQDHQIQVMEDVEVVQSLESVTEDPLQIEEKSAPPRLFSVHQSNVLFFLFFIGAVFCIGGDVFMQIQRKDYVNKSTIFILVITLLNLTLWINFISTNVLKKREDTNIKCVADFFLSVIQYYTT